ncbi:uncharacterized protein A4U43_C10F11860 [Asparagus officinalis]|uniref:Uncharacterized protein n=1 Tax=Asparagus officinalis TaxID=4686 RepID=A0A5P1E3Z1_ASPOF|nr:uncharacterized protein A4U43_C10F11860 [Asparagus officinalis]
MLKEGKEKSLWQSQCWDLQTIVQRLYSGALARILGAPLLKTQRASSSEFISPSFSLSLFSLLLSTITPFNEEIKQLCQRLAEYSGKIEEVQLLYRLIKLLGTKKESLLQEIDSKLTSPVEMTRSAPIGSIGSRTLRRGSRS